MSSAISPAAIKDAIEAVRSALTPASKSRGPYSRHTPKHQAMIDEYVSLHSNCVAVYHVSKKLGVEVKESSVRTWRAKYQAEVDLMQKNGKTSDLQIKSLPVTKHIRSSLLGEKLDHKVKCYIQAVQRGGSVITTSIVMAAATTIVRRADRNLLAENGGLIVITNNWAKFLL